MANLMVGHQGLALAVHHWCALHACHNPVYTVINLLQADTRLAAPASQDCSLRHTAQAQNWSLHLSALVVRQAQGKHSTLPKAAHKTSALTCMLLFANHSICPEVAIRARSRVWAGNMRCNPSKLLYSLSKLGVKACCTALVSLVSRHFTR